MFLILVYLCLSLLVCDALPNNPIRRIRSENQEWSCRKPIVEITVSPIVNKQFLRVLDISWDSEEIWSENDWVGLYKEPPTEKTVAIFRADVHNYTGWIRTNIQEGRKFDDNPTFQKNCSGFWAAYWKQGRPSPAVISCLSSNPRWMEEDRSLIGSLRLTDTFFPGTHDSGAFQLSYSPFKPDRYMKYVFAQDESILGQLLHGARYLDFRIGKYENGFWLNHGIAKVRPIEHSIFELKEFLNKTEEIVVIDFHRFEVGFKKQKDHEDFIAFLRKELGDYAASPGYGWKATLNDIWSSKKRLILSYSDFNGSQKHRDFLWSSISQKWGDVQSPGKLYSYFQSIFSMTMRPGNMWAAMTELTADGWSIITDEMKGLRAMADLVNHDVSDWFRGDWGSKCNAVAVDFIRSTSIVNSAIKWNRRKAAGSNCDNKGSE